jgi:4-hydroxy-3-polyprenylbenzoate decarboxylase
VDQSLRGFLAELEHAGELYRVRDPVSLRYELSALLAAADRGPALLFEQVDGSTMSVVGGVLGSRARIARALGVEVGGIQARMLEALSGPLEPVQVSGAPCQEVVASGGEFDLERLPIPWFFCGRGAP